MVFVPCLNVKVIAFFGMDGVRACDDAPTACDCSVVKASDSHNHRH